jgi:hypothetical protein
MRYALITLVALGCIGKVGIAEAQQNCNTALTRIAKRAAEKAVADHRDDACAGLKKGPIGVDKTRALELRQFSLCETGPVVAASMTVYAKCATSDRAVFQTEFEVEVSATASANLDTCQVLNADVSSPDSLVDAGIKVADLKTKLREAAEKEIKAYCK